MRPVSTLFVIRHGQASFGAADYDHLTPLGIDQAARLGAFFALDGRRLDALFSGPRRRQIDSARHFAVAGGYGSAAVVDGFDEYPAEVIMRRAAAGLLAAGDEEARAVFGDDPHAPPTDGRAFQRMFERVMRNWARGDFMPEGAESFAHFGARVRSALVEVMKSAGRGKQVAVFTSAGPVSIAAQLALGLTDEMAMRQSWVVANSSVTELRFRGDELTLVAFNALPHAAERRWVTYR